MEKKDLLKHEGRVNYSREDGKTCLTYQSAVANFEITHSHATPELAANVKTCIESAQKIVDHYGAEYIARSKDNQ